MTRTHFKTGSAIPTRSGDAAQLQPRSDLYGASHVRNELLAWAEEGSYFKATNPTMGTGIAQTIQASFAASNAIASLRNTSLTKAIIPHYMRLICTVAGASATSSQLAVIADTVNRYSSGGSDLTSQIACANTALGPASIADLRFGALTCAAAVLPRILGRCVLKTATAPALTVGDEIIIAFGDASLSPSSGQTSGASPLTIVKNIGPMVLAGQNHTLLFHLWNPANATTAPSWEVEFAWWER